MDDDVFENFVDESYENRIPIETLLGGSLDSGFSAEKLLTSLSRRRRRRRAIPNVEAAHRREISWTDYPFGITNDNIVALDTSRMAY